MKLTFAKPYSLNGELLAAGTYEVTDKSAEKLITKGVAVAAAEGAKLGPDKTPAPAEKKTRKSRGDQPAAE